MENDAITMSVGRDYRTTTKYEYVVFKGDEVLTRAGFFTSAFKARRAGIKAAQERLGTLK